MGETIKWRDFSYTEPLAESFLGERPRTQGPSSLQVFFVWNIYLDVCGTYC